MEVNRDSSSQRLRAVSRRWFLRLASRTFAIVAAASPGGVYSFGEEQLFRLASSVPYGQTFSDDDGKTWSIPIAMQEARSVQPSLAVMKDGGLVLTGRRPGIFAWLNRDGTGQEWLQVDLQSHHNTHQPADAISAVDKTTSYTEVEPLDDHSVIVIYDRIPNGWNAIPERSQDTNSIWVVKVSWK